MQLRLIFVFLFLAKLAIAQSLPDLKLTWDLETNYLENDQHRATWTLTNKSEVELTDSNWTMYWNMIQRDIVTGSESAPVEMSWINGDYFKMKPKSGFSLAPGASITITYRGEGGMIKESDAPTGIYLAYDSGEEEHLTPLADYDVLPFIGEEQINRSPTDKEPIPTAEWLYQQNSIVQPMQKTDLVRVVPTPQMYKPGKGNYLLNSDNKIYAETKLKQEANFLKAGLSKYLNADITISANDDEENGILLQLEEGMGEEYSLTISKKRIEIKGGQAGVFYAIQTLLSLISNNESSGMTGAILFPIIKIEDKPAFDYRGMHLDLARNYQSTETVKRLIDVMASYKLNKLQLRLTDDEAWRLEIEELPELTEYLWRFCFSGEKKT